ncbi:MULTISPECIES: LynF/TruF/PatF family peptide O-prenyltransferase [unclassified Microcoleus]|uniref:LynF/TruF/PatF family peptide O-prenyltransferase n=1 Tax=unclassified Microcoleus TaxID=2642155 RepID=UPI0025D39379|nr:MULTISPECIES: LynF/TruF/PatF family peptide O-prenyltransferase [unclassified Microcoleus]
MPMLQNSGLREQRIQYMRAHQDAFDVENIFPLPLLEKLTLEIESLCFIEPSCKVEGNQLFGGRFTVGCDRSTSWPGFLTPALKFLDDVESQVGVKIDRHLFQRFLGLHINSPKIIDNGVGIDLRPQLEKSSLKIHFNVGENPEELVRTALALDGSQYSAELIQALMKDVSLIGFDFFLDGRSEVELYAAAPGGKAQSQGDRGLLIKAYIQKNFSSRVNFLMDVSDILMVGFSQANSEPVIYFGFTDIQDIPKYFLFDNLGNRVYDFCKSREHLKLICVGVTEQDLESNRLENFRLYYNREGFA